MRDKAPTSGTLATPYAPTPAEQAAVDALVARRHARKPAPGMKVVGTKGVGKLEIDHPDRAVGTALVMNALGTAEPAFMSGLLRQLANAGSQGREVDEQGLNFMLAVVRGVEPADQVEAMLAAQMAAVHNATMTFARRLAQVETVTQQDSAERAFNKLARTFATQVEALKRYRTGGEQRVTVEHVTVNDGGQAIVGAVAHGGRASEKAGATP